MSKKNGLEMSIKQAKKGEGSNPNQSSIYVTQPSLPPLEDYVNQLKQIWDNKILTNNGPFHQQFEKQLAKYLKVPYISLFSNGTLALVTALQALGIEGEVITTPYSFVATTHSLWWNGIKPVFVDVDPDTSNLDPSKIEDAITSKTTAIMPVHVYGNPCDLDEIDRIAKKHNLKVIYDAAHAFGVLKNNKSVLNFGDLSILSFHATKTFNTIEGGAIICHDQKTKLHIDQLKNFGYVDEITVIQPGINAKMNELQSAFGLLQLNTIEREINLRRNVVLTYRELLKDIKGISFYQDIVDVEHNYSYFPIFISQIEFGISRDQLYHELKSNNIFGRRYFYPLISNFPPYNKLDSAKSDLLPHASKISDEVICLPLYANLKNEDITRICNVIISSYK